MEFEIESVGNAENDSMNAFLDLSLFISCQTVTVEIERDETGMTYRYVKAIPGKADEACDKFMTLFTKKELENLLLCTRNQERALRQKLNMLYPYKLQKESHTTIALFLKIFPKMKNYKNSDSSEESEIAIQSKIAFLENLHGLILMTLKTLSLYEEAVQTTDQSAILTIDAPQAT